MTCTYNQAIDEMFALVSTQWASNTTAIVGYVPVMYWPGLDSGALADNSKFWARIESIGIYSTQVTLSNIEQFTCKRRYTNIGVLQIEITSPTGDIAGVVKLRNLSEFLLSVLRTKTENVWFRNAKIDELNPLNGCARNRVMCQYQHDTIS